jgi:hypothetical protein
MRAHALILASPAEQVGRIGRDVLRQTPADEARHERDATSRKDERPHVPEVVPRDLRLDGDLA